MIPVKALAGKEKLLAILVAVILLTFLVVGYVTLSKETTQAHDEAEPVKEEIMKAAH